MIASIAEIPFRERPLLELLGFEEGRLEPDLDCIEFGWARASRLWLAEPGGETRRLDDVLVLALHCPDDGEELDDDIELYFELHDEGDDPPSFTVLASRFFASWLPRIPADASAVVLALCNPHQARLPQPPATRLPVHYALGYVESWQDLGDGRIELRAPSWQVARPGRDEPQGRE